MHTNITFILLLWIGEMQYRIKSDRPAERFHRNSSSIGCQGTIRQEDDAQWLCAQWQWIRFTVINFFVDVWDSLYTYIYIIYIFIIYIIHYIQLTDDESGFVPCFLKIWMLVCKFGSLSGNFGQPCSSKRNLKLTAGQPMHAIRNEEHWRCV